MIVRTLFLSRRQAEQLEGRGDILMVSITDTASPVKLRPGFRDVLRLSFDDYDRERDGMDAQRVAFSSEEAATLKGWIASYVVETVPLILVAHCNAGISRSAAVAWWVHRAFGATLGTRFPVYHLNRHVLRLLDPAIDPPPIPVNAPTLWELMAEGRQDVNDID